MQAKVAGIKRAEEMELLRERAAKAEAEARELKQKLEQAETELNASKTKQKQLEVTSLSFFFCGPVSQCISHDHSFFLFFFIRRRTQ